MSLTELRNRQKPGTSPGPALSPGASGSPRWLLPALMVAVATITLIVHWPALSAQAISFDDHQYLIDNPLVRNPSWANARRFLAEVLEPSTVEGYYQPLTMISLMLDVACGGRPEHLEPFHRTSLILHAVNTGLIILLLYQLFGNIWAAVAAGLLFGVHPLTVEPIPWIGERKTLLASVFAMLAMITYVRYTQRGGRVIYGLSLVSFLLALLSKPTSTPLPLVLLLLDYWPLRRLTFATVIEKVPFLALAMIFAVVTIISQGRTSVAAIPTGYTAVHIPLILCHNTVFYLWKLIWPVNLSTHYPFPQPFALTHPAVLRGVIGTTMLLLFLGWSLRRTRTLATGWLIFFVAILPTMQIIGFTNVIASDKYAYWPSIGLLLVLTWLLGKLAPVGKPCAGWKCRALVAALLLVAVTEAAVTRRTLLNWMSTEAHYNHMISLAPHVAELHGELGLELAEQGQLDKAVHHYREALRLKPAYAEAHNNLANALDELGQSSEAIRLYEEALRLRPGWPLVHNNLGATLDRQGRFREAILHYTAAIQQKPLFAEAHVNLGHDLARVGQTREAIHHLVEGLRINPDLVQPHLWLADLLAGQNRLEEAAAHYQQALQIDPNLIEARERLQAIRNRAAKRD